MHATLTIDEVIKALVAKLEHGILDEAFIFILCVEEADHLDYVRLPLEQLKVLELTRHNGLCLLRPLHGDLLARLFIYCLDHES